MSQGVEPVVISARDLTDALNRPASSVERTRVAEFKAHLQKFFAPRDCAHVNPESP
jgi:hypothetical protein